LVIENIFTHVGPNGWTIHQTVEDYDKSYSLCIAAASSSSATPLHPWSNQNYIAASCCEVASENWEAASISYDLYQRGFSSPPPPRTVPSGDHITVGMLAEHCSDRFTKLCDGYSRAMCAPSTTGPKLYAVLTKPDMPWLTGETVRTEPSSFPVPSPSCKIQPFDCNRIYKEFYEAFNRDMDAFIAKDPRVPLFPKRHRMACPQFDIKSPYDKYNLTDISQIPLEDNFYCTLCRPSSDEVDLLFWRQEVDDDVVCSNSTFNFNVNSTQQIHTATHYNNTLTSPTVYAFFPTFSMKHCGTTRYNVAIPVSLPSIRTLALLTQTGKFSHQQSRAWSQLNPAHWYTKTVILNGSTLVYPLVPYTAYSAGMKTFYNLDAKTVYNNYPESVYLLMSNADVRTMDGYWRSCTQVQEVLWLDPPVFLTPILSGSLLVPEFVTELPTPQPAAIPTTTPLIETAFPSPDPPSFQPEPFLDSHPSHLNPFPDSISPSEVHISVITIRAKPTTYMSKSPGSPDHNGGPNFFHGVQDLDHQAAQASYDPIAQVWIRTETNAIFSLPGKGTLTATQVGSSEYVIDGNTISVGGSAINVHGSYVSAYESGVVIWGEAQPTGTVVRSSSAADGNLFHQNSDNGQNNINDPASGTQRDGGEITESIISGTPLSKPKKNTGSTVLLTLVLMVLSIFIGIALGT
jgi:hypothetical protein